MQTGWLKINRLIIYFFDYRRKISTDVFIIKTAIKLKINSLFIDRIRYYATYFISFQ